MPTIKIDKIKKANLVAFLNRLLTVDPTVYFTIDSKLVSTSMHTQAHDTALILNRPIQDFFETKENIDVPIRVSLYQGVPEKLIKYLSNFDQGALGCNIKYIIQKSDGVAYAHSIELFDGTLKMTVNCKDPSLGFVLMTPAQVEKVFSNPNQLIEFQMNESTLGRLHDLSKHISKDDEMIQFYADENGLHAQHNVFDMIIDPDSKELKGRFNLFKKHLNKIPSNTYAVKFYTKHMLLETANKDTRLAIALAIS